jgi:integrase
VPRSGAGRRSGESRLALPADIGPTGIAFAPSGIRNGAAVQRLAQWRAAMEVRWSENYKYDIARFCRTEIEPKLGARVLAETKREDWTALVAAKTKKSASAGANLYRTCSSFLGHAEAHGWIPLPLLPRKGAMTIAPAVAPRERTLSDEELIAVWKAAEAESPRQRAFVRLLILTAGRRSER